MAEGPASGAVGEGGADAIAVAVFRHGADGAALMSTVRLARRATVADAIRAAGLRWPDHELRAAVFGVLKDDDERVHDGDRIDLLGPLRVDPKEARRRRSRANPRR